MPLSYRLTALLLAAAATAAPALSNPRQTVSTGLDFEFRNYPIVVHVDVSNFDLETPKGLAGAHKRVVSTAYQICDTNLHGVSSDQVAYRACIADVVDRAILGTGHYDLVRFHVALGERDRVLIYKDIPADWQN